MPLDSCFLTESQERSLDDQGGGSGKIWNGRKLREEVLREYAYLFDVS
jgi:hypothetical protein